MIALILAAVLAQADAGVPAPKGVDQLYTGCKSDVPLAVMTDAGFLIPDERVALINCRQAACEAYAAPKLLEDSGPAHPGTVLLLTGGGVVLVTIAVIVGYFIPHPTK
jgi:hypothetical protein